MLDFAASPQSLAIHATAVSIGRRALIVRGPSKAGKSSLALALIATGVSGRPIRLIGDDRVLLTYVAGAILVSPHPSIAGMIEKRGSGILTMPYTSAVPLTVIVDLVTGPDGTPGEAPAFIRCGDMNQSFPCLVLAEESDRSPRCQIVLDWIFHLFPE